MHDPGGENDTIVLEVFYGSRLRFVDLGEGHYVAYPGVHATMTRTEVTTGTYVYTVTASQQDSYVFDDAGHWTAYQDPRGNTTTLSYTNGITLARVTGPGGYQWLDLDYDAEGWLVSVEDHTGRVVGFG